MDLSKRVPELQCCPPEPQCSTSITEPLRSYSEPLRSSSSILRASTSQSPCAASASQDRLVPQHFLNTQANTIYQLDVLSSPPPGPLDDIASEVPEHLKVLILSTVNDNHLSNTLTSDLKNLFQEHSSTFATSPTDIGYCDIIEHDIDAGDTYPITQSPRRPPLSVRQADDDILDEMLQSGVIEPSESAWVSPVCLVKKKAKLTDFVLIIEESMLFLSVMLFQYQTSAMF